jgi:hypothetical protein
MKRLKGPELKMPEMKVPPFLEDLYHDLRDRRLLPLVGLVLVAIVAVPFLLGGGSSEVAEEPETSAVDALKEAAGHTSALTVVEAQPGLRDYRKRLEHESPTDPFHQRFTGSQTKGGANLPEPTGEGSGGGGGGEKTSTSTTTSGEAGGSSPAPSPAAPPAPSPEEGSGGGLPPSGSDAGNTDNPPSAVIYAFGVDVRIVHSSGSDADGTKKTDDPVVRNRVLPPAPLPGKKTGVVTYLGLSPKTESPLFLISTEVTGVFGEGKCVSGTDTCQLIELEKGFPETFVYGEKEDRYKITVTGVHFIVTGHS